jgi:hypothetical protein
MYRTASHKKEFFMKNAYKLIGIAALALVIVFSFAACGNPASSGGGGGNKAAGLESEHFIITCEGFEENENTLIKLRDILEGSYNRITTTLQVSLSDKSNFILYPDSNSFLSYLNAYYPGMNFGASSVGTYFNNYDEDEVRMVTPGNPPRQYHDFNSLLQVAVHEWVHLVAQRLNNPLTLPPPSYLGEGVAVYLAGQNNGVQQKIASDIKNGKFPASLNAIQDVYNYGYALVEYIVHQYGNERLVNLYKTLKANTTNADAVFQACFGSGITETQFMSDWKAYCIAKYK